MLAFDEFEQFDAKIGEGAFNLDLLSTIRKMGPDAPTADLVFAGSRRVAD